jgi:8-oxo-dGTP pyrophosphatase MutT (NUDIX family)
MTYMEIGVFALIKNEAGEVLLVRDATRQQKWTLPGGGPELAELMPETPRNLCAMILASSISYEHNRVAGVGH